MAFERNARGPVMDRGFQSDSDLQELQDCAGVGTILLKKPVTSEISAQCEHY